MQLAWDNCQTHAPTQLSTCLKGILPVNTVAIVCRSQSNHNPWNSFSENQIKIGKTAKSLTCMA